MFFCFFFFKQKTAYEMRISDWSSDVCSSDLHRPCLPRLVRLRAPVHLHHRRRPARDERLEMARLHAFVPVHACLSGSGRYLLGCNRPRAVERPDYRKEESMAGSVTKVNIVGNLGAAREASTLNNGGDVVNMRLPPPTTGK